MNKRKEILDFIDELDNQFKNWDQKTDSKKIREDPIEKKIPMIYNNKKGNISDPEPAGSEDEMMVLFKDIPYYNPMEIQSGTYNTWNKN